MKKNSILIFFVFICLAIQAQKATIKGKLVVDENSNVPVFLTLKGTHFSCQTDSLGNFIFTTVSYGEYRLQVNSLGYEKKEIKIQVSQPELIIDDIKLEAKLLDEVIISKSKIELVKDQPFTVEAIDMKPLQNRNLTINQVLGQTTGVRIRETGGLGSDFVFSLSGFTGNQVRFFVDGLPSEILGAAYSINNVPVNTIERIEIYKGVVPIHLGSDALGGAVNIVTNTKLTNFLDASYSYGSFNTHQTNLTGKYGFKNGFVVSGSSFHNYSDNTFKIDTYLFDKQTGKRDEFSTKVTRFNDGYKALTGNIEFGFVKKRFADRLMFGLIGSSDDKEIQNGANMTIVSGEVRTKSRALIPTIKYEKANFLLPGLSLKMSGLYSKVHQQSVDTSSRVYDWTGAYTYKSLSNFSGELNWYKTLFTFEDKTFFGMATLNYKIGEFQQLTLNNTCSSMTRIGTDPIKVSPIPFNDPNTIKKNFLGISYQAKLLNDKLTAIAFGKMFHLNSLLYDEVYNEETDENEIHKKMNSKVLPGFGAAANYFLLPYLQLKFSYENTYRLPEGYEIFGDGLLLIGNPLLQPEKSQNFNTGFLFGKKFKQHLLNVEFNYLYRLPTNLIRSVAMGVTSVYQNLGNAEIHCFEGAITYKYKTWLTFEINSTLQNIRNTAMKEDGSPDLLYGDRLPNTPYFFSNASLSLAFKSFGKLKNQISVNWNTSYIEEFYLKWESQGSLESKFVIPKQLVNNVALSYSSQKGRYNVSMNCLNLFDSLNYDNFRIQKPGRSFSIKLRYYLVNN